MIDIILDFKDVKSEFELSQLLYKNLFNVKVPEKQIGYHAISWDAIIDYLRTILYREWDKYNEEDWKNYDEYLKEKKLDSWYGVKNEQGVRDDMRLIFKNFRPFYLNNKTKVMAHRFLEILFETIEEVNSDDWKIDGMMNKMEILIES